MSTLSRVRPRALLVSSRLPVWVLAVVGTAALSVVTPLVAALMVAFTSAGIAWRWPRTITAVLALGILAVRPTLDAFGGRQFGTSAFAVNPAVIFGLSVLLLGLVLAVRRGRDGQHLWPDKEIMRTHLWLLLAYSIGLMSAVTGYGLSGLGTAAREMIRVAALIIGFLVVCWWIEDNTNRVRWGWLLLCLGAIPPLAFAVWQLATGTGNLDLEGVNRLQGTFSHPNTFGVYLVPFVLFLVGSIPAARQATRIACVVGAAILCAFIVLSYSRTALLVLAAALAVVPFLQGRLGPRTMLVTGLFGVLILGLAWWVAGDLIRERFANLSFSREVWDAAATGQSENSFTWRLLNWGVLLQMGMAHPFVGHGAGMTTVLNPLISPINDLPFNAHNDFVRFFFETGLLGLCCYVLYAASLCYWTLKQARQARRENASTAYGVAAALVSVLFLSLGTTEVSLNTAILYQLYGMLALVYFSAHPRRERAPVSDYRKGTHSGSVELG
jgi:O-antigen ligase